MKLLPKHFYLVFAATVLVEFVVISYNLFTGFLIIAGPLEFLARLFFGTLLAYLPAMLMFAINLKVVWYFNRAMPWHLRYRQRIPAEFLVVVATAVVISSLITLAAHAIAPYKEGLLRNLINNGLITTSINIVIATVVEAWYYFLNWRDAAVHQQKLEAAVAVARYESLRNQVNPHFLFNSLNVLSALVKKDPVLAERFIDEFARIYRYVLETTDKQVVTLEAEVDFARSFLFLQKIRYGAGLGYIFEVPATLLNQLVVPLSLQLLLENAVKHNAITPDSMLTIRISAEGNRLTVRNNLQPKQKSGWSSGLGLKNLKERYALLTEEVPVFQVTENEYVAKLPLIQPES